MMPNAPELPDSVVHLRSNDAAFKLATDTIIKVIARRAIEIHSQLETKMFHDIVGGFAWPPNSAWEILVNEKAVSVDEQFLLAVVFTIQRTPHLIAEILENPDFLHHAGVREKAYNHEFYPTLRTVLFLLAGTDELLYISYYGRLVESRLFSEQIILIEEDKELTHEEQTLYIPQEYYLNLMNGSQPTIDNHEDFPAERLETKLCFDDLVLKESVVKQLEPLMAYVKDTAQFTHDKIKQGYVALFYGPPGTGKTATASVLGKELGVEVYCIDLSRVVSKYVGETEKNLEKVFARLEYKRCILLFDEADALFGKRSEVKGANDRYANQEVAYLLQRIEKFEGLVILTSNYNQNLDGAFKRRILSSIYMPPPSPTERKVLWRKAIPDNFKVRPDGLLDQLAEQYQLTGANINNVIKLGCIRATMDSHLELTKNILEPIIKAEQLKEKNS